jgi:hypothetical protein
MEDLVRELNAELSGAKFVIEDAVRTTPSKSGLAVEFLTRSVDFEHRLLEI